MIITISRQAGTNGALIGQLVAEHLHLRFYDRELLDEIARRFEVDKDFITRYDESTLNIVESVLWEWRSSINEETYGRYLREALQRIQREGDAVIIGRGANFLLTGPDTLHVRIVAPVALRIAMYEVGENVSERIAKRWVHAEDRRRAAFVRKHFNTAIDHPVNYDLTINLAGLSVEDAAQLIIKAAEIRQKERIPAGPEATLPGYVDILARHRRPVKPGIVEREDRKR